ncbi:2-hydroxychromene-2-carboxylate isomerase [Mameliella alba]|nr:2-hydroxychromene-2-carboxylate isomerase [Antarctobacter heliothermus]MBY6143214.1 2-hydroxychromene-2-carboxylate isomerase [Mameliella alba]MBY6163185.1 2-hydroxychromene-2-carboxylate isomerase [Mameliella alba]MBY6171449.1 2-hydroxychromene-2-carboxylate isomerase [Mameliella alba]MBY6176673.1 2-hydroxychromene-2-carboxylate isomerase [Mameliella alba]
MAHIDYFFSTISPFTYFAGTRLEEIAAKHGATIAYKPLDIQALFARTGGTPLPQRHPSRQAYRLQEIARTSKKTGLPVNPKPAHFPTNPAPSSYAIIAAQKAGGGDLGKLVHSILAACWAGEKDIAEDAVIKTCLSEAGFDPALADTGLLAGAETYPANLEDAIEKGVFGAPTYVVDDGAVFWGNDRLDDLDAHLAGQL